VLYPFLFIYLFFKKRHQENHYEIFAQFGPRCTKVGQGRMRPTHWAPVQSLHSAATPRKTFCGPIRLYLNIFGIAPQCFCGRRPCTRGSGISKSDCSGHHFREHDIYCFWNGNTESNLDPEASSPVFRANLAIRLHPDLACGDGVDDHTVYTNLASKTEDQLRQ
jgi:hypothetical protein